MAALARRSALGRTDRLQASAAAVAHLTGLVEPGEKVALFLPIRGEIDPGRLGDVVRARAGMVLLPAIVGSDIVFRAHDPGAPLEPGAFGTRQPPADASEHDPDLIVAPLAAFDGSGNRIGYGGGYYDRAVARLTAAGHRFRFFGVAFACQEVEAVPAEPHDRRLGAVITERGIAWFQEQA